MNFVVCIYYHYLYVCIDWIFQQLVNQLHECQCKRVREPLTILTDVVDTFEFEDVKGFLRV